MNTSTINRRLQVGDTVRWDGSRRGYTVTEVTAEGFRVAYNGRTFGYSHGAPVSIIEQAPAAEPVKSQYRHRDYDHILVVVHPQAAESVKPQYITSALTPQARTVYDHIKRTGSISLREAIADHSIQSLTRRISELRDAGIDITVDSRKHPITKQRYARYSFSFPHLAA
jgi:hypothetical protein